MKQKVYIGEGGGLDGTIIVQDAYDHTFTTFMRFTDISGKIEISRGYVSFPLEFIISVNTNLTYIGDL